MCSPHLVDLLSIHLGHYDTLYIVPRGSNTNKHWNVLQSIGALDISYKNLQVGEDRSEL